MIRRVEELDLKDKIVFVRVDFNVPIDRGKIAEAHRIESALPTLRLLLERACKVVVASHLGRPKGKKDPNFTLAPVRDHLQRCLQHAVRLTADCVGPDAERAVRGSDRVILLENLRFHKEEEDNDPAFARALASLADAYVNDAFGAAHRAHASISGITAFLKLKGSGLLLQKELDYLSHLLTSPEKPFVTLLGGAKVSDKIGVIKNLMPKIDVLLIGGGMAYTFLKAKGIEVGKSLVEEDRIDMAKEILESATASGLTLHLPVDHITGDQKRENPMTSEPGIPPDRLGLDIGPRTVRRFADELRKAKMVLWNGPVGLFENEAFSQGTRSLALTLAENQSGLISVVAGGDTVAAVTAAGVEQKITHLSTGGGATLEFLEGKELPGIKALEEVE